MCIIKNTEKEETPTQVFSCENCEIFKNSFFDKIPQMVASETESTCELENQTL